MKADGRENLQEWFGQNPSHQDRLASLCFAPEARRSRMFLVVSDNIISWT